MENYTDAAESRFDDLNACHILLQTAQTQQSGL